MRPHSVEQQGRTLRIAPVVWLYDHPERLALREDQAHRLRTGCGVHEEAPRTALVTVRVRLTQHRASTCTCAQPSITTIAPRGSRSPELHHLRGQTLLHLRAASVQVHHAGEFAQTGHLTVRAGTTHMRHAVGTAPGGAHRSSRTGCPSPAPSRSG